MNQITLLNERTMKSEIHGAKKYSKENKHETEKHK